MHNKGLKDFIIVIKNAVPIEICDRIIEEYENCSRWRYATINVEDERSPIKDIRNCEIIKMSNADNLKINQKRTDLDISLFRVMEQCLANYRGLFKSCSVSQDSGYDLLRYNQHGFYKEHTDSFAGLHREVACSLTLNDNFIGGDFSFFNKGLQYKLEKGDALMFPSNFMYPHQIMEITEGTRYSIITWFK
jgi:predicted 2-oxoglutarate/Fe(II)-dependent dioxygenase YbiX